MQLCLYDEKAQFDIRIMVYHHPITAHAQILSRRSNHFIRKLLWPPIKAASIRRISSPVHFYSRQQDGDHPNKHTVIFISFDSNGLHCQEICSLQIVQKFSFLKFSAQPALRLCIISRCVLLSRPARSYTKLCLSHRYNRHFRNIDI